MRLFAFVICCVTIIGWTAFANAGCGCGGPSPQSYNSLSGPACFSPPGCAVAPGCCECPPTACDNAWDGYCQEKAKWQAFFSRVGTGHASCCPPRHCASAQPTPVTSETSPKTEVPVRPAPAVQNRPAVNVAPAVVPPTPAAEKTTRARVLYPWSR
jgi:hypothetical protein